MMQRPPMEEMTDGVKEAVDLLLKLSEREREDVFARFCQECGTADPRCQCWNDE